MDELPLVIDCQTCVARMSEACGDCIVTFLCDATGAEPVVVNQPDARVLRLLHDGGLIPGNRHQPRAAAS